MANKKAESSLGRCLAELDMKVADVRREQRRLNEILKLDQNWSSEIRSWFGKVVQINTRSGNVLIGILKWSDKYHIAIHIGKNYDIPTLIINKGAIETIGLIGDKDD